MKFGLWNGGLFREVPWIIWLVIDWCSWRASVRPEHAEALGIGEHNLHRTFDLVVTRAAIREALAKVQQPLPRLAQEMSPVAVSATAATAMAAVEGEPLQAFLDRTVREAVAALDRSVREAVATREPRLPAPPLPVPPLPASLCPADEKWTVAIWKRNWGPPWPRGEREAPDDRFFPEDHRKAFEYRVERDATYAVIEFLDQWERGHWELRGRRIDTQEGFVETVCPGLRNNPYMALYLRAGRFEPLAGAPPTRLPRYSELRVYPVKPPPLVQPEPEVATGPTEAVEVSPMPPKELQDATNDEIDAMLRRLWEQRSNPKRGLSRDKAALKQWKQALAEQGLTSTWGMVRARYGHNDNKYLRGPPGQ